MKVRLEEALSFGVLADRRHVWHPFTQMGCYDPETRFIESAEGHYLIDRAGRRIFDAASSIWLSVHGHCHPKIVTAIAEQAARLDHATLLGQSNLPAALLAQRLTSLMPPTLQRVFFSSDGSSAVEAGLKIAAQYWHNKHAPRRTFIAHKRGYHGDTIGAISVSGVEDFLSPFVWMRFATIQLPWSDVYLVLLEDALKRCGSDVAAVIIEPLVQAAGGVRTMLPSTLKSVEVLCREYGALLIVDEIATGFGRTGSMFAFEQAGISPDIVLLGKAMSGGALPLSAAIVSEEIYTAFLGSQADAVHFFHGHSFAGNPIACAAGLANLDIFDDEQTLQRMAERMPAWHARLDAMLGKRHVKEIRKVGYFVGVELNGSAQGAGVSQTGAWSICDRLWGSGFFVRPIGQTLLLAPPLSASEKELEALSDALEFAVGD